MPLIPLRPLLDHAACGRGVCAINVNSMEQVQVDTDCRLAMTAAVREALASAPAEFDPRFYWTPARSAMRTLCEERMRQFGQAGRASGVPLITLEKMAQAYAAGRYGRSARPAAPHEAHRTGVSA